VREGWGLGEEGDRELKVVQWSEDEGEGGEKAEEFKPAMEVKIRSR
jgi:hypothetical protein